MFIVVLVVVFSFFMRIELCSAGNFVIIGAPVKATGVQCPLVLAYIHTACRQTLVGRAVALGHGPSGQAVLRNFLGDGMSHHVDHTANGARAVEQCRRAAQHLDLVSQEGLHGNCMVLADRRGIGSGHVVVQHTHACAFETPDDRPANILTKAGIGQTGHVAEGIAEVVGHIAVQCRAAQYRGRLGHFQYVAAQRCGGNHDFFQRFMVMICTMYPVVWFATG